jgi:type II secretory pathway component GspD/PulD (secretin)/tetratricopeptide (TPR) repeat protein
LNTQKRSKILAVGVAGALLAGASLPLLPFAIAHAEAQSSSSTTLLDRGTQLISQHEYQTAKQVLLSIDPSTLSAADQTRLASLLQKADAGIAGMSMDLTVYHNATASLQDGHYAHAAKLFAYLIKSPDVSPELKSEAADNLALTRAKQQQLVPQMKSLLQDAIHAYQAGNFDAAEMDLNKIQVSGADLGDQADQVSHYQYLIAQKRVQQVRELEAAQQAKVASAASSPASSAEQKAAAEKKLLAQQQAQEAQRAAATQAAENLKNQQAAKEAAAAKLAAQQKEAQQKLMAQEAAARKLAEEKQAQQAKQAAAEKLAEQQKLEAAKAAAAHKLAEEKMQAQQAAAEKAAAAKLAQQQQMAQQQLLAQQQTQEQQAEQARQAAAAAAAQQAAAMQAQAAATQKAAMEAQQPKPVATAEAATVANSVKASPAPATAATSTHNTTPAPAPAPVMVMSPTTTTSPAKAAAATMPATPVAAVAKPSLAEIERERAAALVVKADNDLRNADYQQAVALYNDALALDPKNEAAAMGLRNAQKLALGQSPGLLSQQIYDQAIQAQRAQVLFDNDLQLSNKAMEAGKYPQAVDHANDGLATIEAARGILTAGDYNQMKARAQQQLAIIERQQAQAQAISQAKRAQEVTQSQMQIEHQLAVRRQQQINQLMGQAREYFKQMQYQQALDTLNQVIAIDPQNNTALFMQEMVSDQIQYNEWNKYHKLRSEAEQAQEVKGQEYMIPYPNLEIYPQDWPELSRMREAEQHNSESPADKEARLALARNVSKIVVNNQPFSDVVRLLRQQTGANIVVNWNALNNAGVQRNTPISLTLRGVPFEKVLSLVLQQAQGNGGTQLGYSISGGVLTISTNDQLAQQKTTRVFDIQDLLVQAPNFTAPSFNLQNQSNSSGVQVSSGSSGGGGGAGSSNLFSGGGGGGAGGQQQVGKTRAQMVTEITQLIENTVARNSWIDNGGTVGSIREINGQLVITQTPSNLEKVSGLLKQLRETRSVEISIDARFLYVTTGFLNDFGFSWSLGFGNMFGSNVGTVGTTTNATTGATTSAITGPVSITNNTTTYATPQTTGVTNSIGGDYSVPSLSLSGGILSNYQLSLLLNATQINKRNTLLEAPRITLFNGQRATMIVEDVQNYVQSFTQTAGTGGLVGGVGGVATNLNVLPLTTGLSLSVQATVSSDDRYVIMTIIPQLSQLLSLQTFNINGQNTATAGAATAFPGFVQLPQTQITEVSTTVSVPDGGTLLLGGERLAGETTIEAGVPVLSQIPIINRLFTNTSTTKDNLVLLILVRPRIIIQKEFEKKQFGRNY